MTTPSTEQSTAITANAAVIFTIAGPGTGKTTTLAARVQHDIDSGRADPAGMVVVTYTREAAAHLRAKIKDAHKVGFIGTLHGFCLAILNKRTHTPQAVIDEVRATEWMQDIAKRLKVKASGPELRRGLYSPNTTSGVGLVAASYRREIRTANAVDFDTILLDAFDVFTQPGAPIFSALYVDECQDAAAIDIAIYRAINARLKFLVGDPRQSMYGFRGAQPALLDKWASEPGVFVCSLTESYRLPPLFCTFATSLIGYNGDRWSREKLRSATQGGSPFAAFKEFPTAAAEAEAIREQVANQLTAGADPNSIAILCRFNSLVASLGGALKAAGLPIRIASPKVPDELTVALGAVNALIYPGNDAGAAGWRNRVLMSGHARLQAIAQASGKTLTAVLMESVGVDARAVATGAPTVIFGALVQMRVPPACLAYLRDVWAGSLQETREALIERAEALSRGDDSPAVTVCTIHAAKGREWRHVIVAGLEADRHDENSNDTREERNIVFVAITRAIQSLILTSAKVRPDPYTGQPVTSAPSKFVKEIGV